MVPPVWYTYCYGRYGSFKTYQEDIWVVRFGVPAGFREIYGDCYDGRSIETFETTVRTTVKGCKSIGVSFNGLVVQTVKIYWTVDIVQSWGKLLRSPVKRSIDG